MSSTTLTLSKDHLKKLDDAALRAIALRILTDATSSVENNIADLGQVGGLDNLIVAPAREAVAWLQAVLTNHAGYDDTVWDHHAAARGLEHLADGIGYALQEDTDAFSLSQNAQAVCVVFDSVFCRGGNVQRPNHRNLYHALDGCGGGFIPGHETAVGYVLNAICATDDPRLSALAESYMQSGLHANLQPAINRASKQLASIDELTELNH